MPEDFTISIENNDNQDPDGNHPFIMLYAVTLVQNPTPINDFSQGYNVFKIIQIKRFRKQIPESVIPPPSRAV
jgi:hypothetical protein